LESTFSLLLNILPRAWVGPLPMVPCRASSWVPRTPFRTPLRWHRWWKGSWSWSRRPGWSCLSFSYASSMVAGGRSARPPPRVPA